MSTSPQYEKDRTDDIELLFKALYYLQLIDGCENETKTVTDKLIAEFEHVPVSFDKDKRASRYAPPFRFNENGIVTLTNADKGQHVLLRPWTPENRPQPAVRKKAAPKPNYNALLTINPLWFIQLMEHKGRKTTRHKQSNYAHITEYRKRYQERRIYNTLPKEETAQFLTTDRDLRDSGELNQTLINFTMRFYRLNNNALQRHFDDIFFFLNDAELDLLANAFEQDKPKGQFEGYWGQPNIENALAFITQNTPDDRVVLPMDELSNMTKIVVQKEHGEYRHTINDHTRIWERLHESYVHLNDNARTALRAFDLLDDELLQAKQNELEAQQA